MKNSGKQQLAQQVAQEAKKGILRGLAQKIQTCHWAWLVLGIAIGWPIDWVMNVILGLLNFVAPAVGPMVVDAILGPINDALVSVVPLASMAEILRRWGVLGNDDK